MSLPVLPRFSDAEGYVISNLLSGSYSTVVRAKPANGVGPTIVNVGAKSIAVESIDTAGGSFAATLWVALEWVDPRLQFDENVYNGTLRLDATRIWVPDVYVANLVTPAGLQTIKELPATVLSDGTVRAVFRSVGESRGRVRRSNDLEDRGIWTRGPGSHWTEGRDSGGTRAVSGTRATWSSRPTPTTRTRAPSTSATRRRRPR